MPGVSPVNTGDPDLEYAYYLAERRVLEIQAKLHRWARDDPHRRFGDLFNLVADPAFLLVGWVRVRGNKGARTAGVDGRTAVSIEARGVGEFLGALRDCLKDRSFCPLPSRERLIPKPGTAKRRRLGISTIRDRVVQASLKLVLEPIFEADFHPCSYGFRRIRSSAVNSPPSTSATAGEAACVSRSNPINLDYSRNHEGTEPQCKAQALSAW